MARPAPAEEVSSQSPSPVETPSPSPSRWQLTVSSMLLVVWISFLAWIALIDRI